MSSPRVSVPLNVIFDIDFNYKFRKNEKEINSNYVGTPLQYIFRYGSKIVPAPRNVVVGAFQCGGMENVCNENVIVNAPERQPPTSRIALTCGVMNHFHYRSFYAP